MLACTGHADEISLRAVDICGVLPAHKRCMHTGDSFLLAPLPTINYIYHTYIQAIS